MSDLFPFVIFALVVTAAIVLITGKGTEWTFKIWEGSRFQSLFLGGITDFRTLKIFHRIVGFVILIISIFVYVLALLHRS
jgi:hypothetical protein